MNNIFHAESSDFEQITADKDKVVLVDFYADWCGPCRNLSTILDEVAVKYPNDLLIMKVNVDKNAQLAKSEKYKVRSIPQIFFIKNGEIMQNMTGAQSLEKLSQAVESLK